MCHQYNIAGRACRTLHAAGVMHDEHPATLLVQLPLIVTLLVLSGLH